MSKIIKIRTPLDISVDYIVELVSKATPVKETRKVVKGRDLFGDTPSSIELTIFWENGLRHKAIIPISIINNEPVAAVAFSAQYCRETIIRIDAENKKLKK